MSNKFITVYFTDDFELSEKELLYLERAIGREISYGINYVNIHTSEHKIIQDFVDLVGKSWIKEIVQ